MSSMFLGTSWNEHTLPLFELVADLDFAIRGRRERESHHLCNEQLVCTSTSLKKKAWQQSLNIVFTLPSAPPTTTLKSSYQDTGGPRKKKPNQKEKEKGND